MGLAEAGLVMMLVGAVLLGVAVHGCLFPPPGEAAKDYARSALRLKDGEYEVRQVEVVSPEELTPGKPVLITEWRERY